VWGVGDATRGRRREDEHALRAQDIRVVRASQGKLPSLKALGSFKRSAGPPPQVPAAEAAPKAAQSETGSEAGSDTSPPPKSAAAPAVAQELQGAEVEADIPAERQQADAPVEKKKKKVRVCVCVLPPALPHPTER
jgi:hypothetical protein